MVSQPEDIAASQVDERHESSMDIVPALAQSEADMAQPVYDDYDALYYHDDGDYPPDDDYGHSNSDPSNEACPPDDPSNEVGVGLPEQPPEPQVDPEQVNQEGRESNASESESNAAGPTDTATPSAPTGQCRHAQVITVTEGQKVCLI